MTGRSSVQFEAPCPCGADARWRGSRTDTDCTAYEIDCRACDAVEAAAMGWTVQAQAARWNQIPAPPIGLPTFEPLPESRPWLTRAGASLYERVTGRRVA